MKHLSRLMALVLALLLMMSCAMAEGTFFPYEEPVDVTVLAEMNHAATLVYDSNNPECASENQNIWIDAYKDYLNINVTRELTEDLTALNARLNTGMAGGNLADIMIVSKEMFYVLAENGVLADLSDAYEESKNYPYLTEVLAMDPNAINKGKIDGELLGIPMLSSNYSNTQVLWVRQDWLKKVNKEIPTTIDELVDVARAFQEAKLGGENTVPLAIANDKNNGCFYDFRGVLAAYGVVFNTWEQQEDGSYIFANTSPKMKDGLLKLQEMYKEGLIKSDFAVSQIVAQEVANGACGLFYATAWHGVTDIKASLLNDPEADWIPVRIPTLDGEPVKQWTNDSTTKYYVVNAEYEHPEVLFKMVDLECKISFHSTVEESKYNFNAEGLQLWDHRVFRDFYRPTQIFIVSNKVIEGLKNNVPLEEMDSDARTVYKQCVNAVNGDRADLGRYLQNTIAYPFLEELQGMGMLVGSYDGPITENMTLYQESINLELNNAMLRVIMGEDISVFEKAVETWYATGGKMITKDVNDFYNGAK